MSEHDDELADRLAALGQIGDPQTTERRQIETPAWLVEAGPIVTAVADDSGGAEVVTIVAIPVDEPGWYIVAKRPDTEASGDADDQRRSDDPAGDIPQG